MNILLISPKLYSYSRLIINHLEKKNHKVFWIYDSIVLNNFEKMVGILFKKYGKIKFDKYFRKEIKKYASENIDKIVLIFGDKYFNKNNIELLKSTFPGKKTIFYSWDSVINYPNIKNYYLDFDVAYSFDKNDCKNYNMIFRPLFYSDETDYSFVEIKNDIVGLMSYSYKKKESLKKILFAIPKKIKINLYLYMPNKLIFILNKYIFHREAFNFIEKKYFKFNSMSVKDGKELFASAKAILDSPLLGQNGLTIRTFEALKMKKKLITTNASIRSYDFYNEMNIFVVEDENSVVPDIFLETPFDEKYAISDYYSFNTFMSTIFELERSDT